MARAIRTSASLLGGAWGRRSVAASFSSAASAVRPFRVLGVQQIAVGGADKLALRSLWCDLLGVEHKGTHISESENVDEDILVLRPAVESALGADPTVRDALQVEIDLMQV